MELNFFNNGSVSNCVVVEGVLLLQWRHYNGIGVVVGDDTRLKIVDFLTRVHYFKISVVMRFCAAIAGWARGKVINKNIS